MLINTFDCLLFLIIYCSNFIDMNGVFEFIKESKLLIIKWRGEWSKEHDVKLAIRFKEFSDKYDIENVIQDITDLEFEISKSDVDAMIEVRNKIIEKHFSSVYITGKPKDVVFAHTYVSRMNNDKTKYCSTIERAIQLLFLDNNYSDIYQTYKKLIRDEKAKVF